MGDPTIRFCISNKWSRIEKNWGDITLLSASWESWWISITILNFEFVLRTRQGCIKD